jgi:hypothetical protein
MQKTNPVRSSTIAVSIGVSIGASISASIAVALILATASSAYGATIDDLLGLEARLQQQRDKPVATLPAVPLVLATSTSFVVQGLFGVDGKLLADVLYNGESSRVAVGDTVGPCTVSQIGGSIGPGVALQVKPADVKPAGFKKDAKGTPVRPKAQNPVPPERCPTAKWSMPPAANAQNNLASLLSPGTSPITVPAIQSGVLPVPLLLRKETVPTAPTAVSSAHLAPAPLTKGN